MRRIALRWAERRGAAEDSANQEMKGETMKAIRSNMVDGNKMILHCPMCDGEWSGNAGDYWDHPDNHLFRCNDCGCEMELVEKHIFVEYR